MSSTIGVFVSTNIKLEEFAEDLATILKLSFEFQKDEYEEWFAFRDKRGLFTVGTHDYDNDRDMFFENYKYEIAFWENTDNSPEERERLQNEVGRMLFEKLKETKKYPIILVFDVQKKLDEFNPQNSNSEQSNTASNWLKEQVKPC
jgi:hypothetical protein